MSLMTIIILVIVGIIDLLISKRYEMSEKVDKGIEICYWKLSYRRKLIRTLWLIPIGVFVLVEFYKEFGVNPFTGAIGILIFSTIFVQAFYNYKKWKKDMIRDIDSTRNFYEER